MQVSAAQGEGSGVQNNIQMKITFVEENIECVTQRIASEE